MEHLSSAGAMSARVRATRIRRRGGRGDVSAHAGHTHTSPVWEGRCQRACGPHAYVAGVAGAMSAHVRTACRHHTCRTRRTLLQAVCVVWRAGRRCGGAGALPLRQACVRQGRRDAGEWRGRARCDLSCEHRRNDTSRRTIAADVGVLAAVGCPLKRTRSLRQRRLRSFRRFAAPDSVWYLTAVLSLLCALRRGACGTCTSPVWGMGHACCHPLPPWRTPPPACLWRRRHMVRGRARSMKAACEPRRQQCAEKRGGGGGRGGV
jgi:hypothetical protein